MEHLRKAIYVYLQVGSFELFLEVDRENFDEMWLKLTDVSNGGSQFLRDNQTALMSGMKQELGWK